MKITNKMNLPTAFVTMAEEQREIAEKTYSCTTLLKPVREITLNRRHDAVIENDVSDMIWLLFGTAAHAILEKHDKTGYAEIAMQHTFENGYTLTGKCDLYNAAAESLEDYKTASVWKVLFSDFEDWRKQGLIYAWLLAKLGKLVKQLKFYALLKDWSARDYKLKKLKGEFYPDCAVWTWQYTLQENDLAEIEEFIVNKFAEIITAEGQSDSEIKLCEPSERWNSGDKYAVCKNGRKTALRVLDTIEAAKTWQVENGGDYIETRAGEDRKCIDYCNCKNFCQYYKELVDKNPNI